MSSFKIFFTVFLSFSFLATFGQFKAKTEFEYLKIINAQHSKALIKDNLKNTETVVYSLINSEVDRYAAYFINELSISYIIIGNKQQSFYYLIIQRCLFPNDSISATQKNSFFEVAFSVNLSRNDALEYWETTIQKNLPKNYNDRILLALDLTTRLHFKKLTQSIYHLGLMLRMKNLQVPAWYQHWEFLTIIGLNEKQKKEMIKPEPYAYQPIFDQLEGSLRTKVYRRAIKHYLKTNALVFAGELIDDYQKQDLSFVEKIDLLCKKAKLKLK